MKFQDVQGLSVVELKKKKAAISQEILESKMKNGLGQLANPLVIRHLRRQVAQINTALTKKLVR